MGAKWGQSHFAKWSIGDSPSMTILIKKGVENNLIILVLNSGSSSLKYQVIDMDTEEMLVKGYFERIGQMLVRNSSVHRMSITWPLKK